VIQPPGTGELGGGWISIQQLMATEGILGHRHVRLLAAMNMVLAEAALAYPGWFSRSRRGIRRHRRLPLAVRMTLVMLAAAFVIIPAAPPPISAAHFQLPFSPTEYGENYGDYLGRLQIRGLAAQAGDEVAFVNAQGEICGKVAIAVDGQYGTVPVYGHHLADGDLLGVRVWDARQGREWRDGSVRLKPGTPSTFFVAASVPPIWEKGSGFALDIEVLPRAGDVNGDGMIDLADLVLTLQIQTGGAAAAVTVEGDVNGDGRIGMAEAGYILQRISGSR